jgi:YVTN family beta-propeller protein
MDGQYVGVAFDGGSIWVANSAGGSVTRIDAATASVIGTAATGVAPVVPMFDGANIWAPNFGASTVTKLRAS